MTRTDVDLETAYSDAVSTPSDINEHLPTLVALTAGLDAKLVIELGTRSGVSTVAWLYGLAQTDGRLISVDIDDRPDIGRFPHWQFIRGDDCDIDIYSGLPAGADIVFIDTSHAYAHTVKELALYKWLVRPGGKIVLHDTELPYPMDVGPGPIYPVKKAVVEFCAAEGYEWRNYPNCWGLAVIDIPGGA